VATVVPVHDIETGSGSRSSWEWILLRTKVPENESSPAISLRERKLQGMKKRGSERARERKFQGTNWPYWNFRSRKQIVPGTKRLWIIV